MAEQPAPKKWFVTLAAIAVAGPFEEENECFEWLQTHTPFSWDHATRHEGYGASLRDTVTFNNHVCVREPESGKQGRIWRCMSCHSRDGFYATTCELWTGLNNRFNQVSGK